ncbi:hypothetical protein A9Q84_16735 [Halobacteriovorax marinus]|uniref:Cytochrome b5 heme-binding domain-containing protein n=1 Tax=Halobacteriovorax marinus TaxID=97084 RepID=A0A1Y5F9X9_9BACT|nr:hypothetical protein A9Q84_16735 [Halobacteriovorax marinus]
MGMNKQSHHIDPSQLWEIHGKYYDLTPFIARHPGGKRMLLLSKGMDCTEVFESTHIFDNLPKKMLPKFFVADNPNYKPTYSWEPDGFYNTLRKRVQVYLTEQSNLLDGKKKYSFDTHHGSGWFLVRLVLLFIFSWAATWFGIIEGNLYICAIWPLIAMSFGGYGHEALHAGLFNSVWKNRAVAFFSMDLLGLSSYVYSVVHITGHHAHTNVEEVDPDMVAFYPNIRTFPSQKRYFPHRFQQYYAWPIYFCSLFFANIMDIITFITKKWINIRVERPYFLEFVLFFFFKTAAISILIVLPFFLHDTSKALTIVLLTTGVTGFLINLTFAVNHKNNEAIDYLTNDKRGNDLTKYDWGEFQILTTCNFQHGHWFTDMIFAGLTHQVEHHLFPMISYQHLPKISLIVQETCKDFDIKYNLYPTYFAACKAHFKYLKDLGREPSLENVESVASSS